MMAMANTFVLQMYNSNTLLSSLVQLGQWFREEAHLDEEIQRTALAQNGWFTAESVRGRSKPMATRCLRKASQLGQKLHVSRGTNGRESGIDLGGQLAACGVARRTVCGAFRHEVHVKASKDDAVLPRWVVAKWAEFAPYVADAVVFHDGLMQHMDAVIATGGANASRYFEAYFGHLPHVFRGPRTSVAVLDGAETDAELDQLGEDIFAHPGMGCRSVTKVWLPKGFDLTDALPNGCAGVTRQHGKREQLRLPQSRLAPQQGGDGGKRILAGQGGRRLGVAHWHAVHRTVRGGLCRSGAIGRAEG